MPCLKCNVWIYMSLLHLFLSFNDIHLEIILQEKICLHIQKNLHIFKGIASYGPVF